MAKQRTKVIIELEYDPEQSATIDQLLTALKSGVNVVFNTDHCKLLDACSSFYDVQMICPECSNWVWKRPSGPPARSRSHTSKCSYFEDADEF